MHKFYNVMHRSDCAFYHGRRKYFKVDTGMKKHHVTEKGTVFQQGYLLERKCLQKLEACAPGAPPVPTSVHFMTSNFRFSSKSDVISH